MNPHLVWEQQDNDICWIVPGPADAICIYKQNKPNLIPATCIKFDNEPMKDVFAANLGGEIYFEYGDIHVGKRNALGLETIYSETITAGIFVQRCITGQGHVIYAGDEPWGFDLYDPNGNKLVTGLDLHKGKRYFQQPDGLAPFWETGSNSVYANSDSFVIGGGRLGRIDHYHIAGHLIKSITEYLDKGDVRPVGELNIERVALEESGRVWATNGDNILITDGEGRLNTIASSTELLIRNATPTMESIFLLDRNKHLWTTIRYQGESFSRFVCLDILHS